MSLNKLSKAALIEMIDRLQDELVHASQSVSNDTELLPWEERPVPQEQAKTSTHAESMRIRMAAARLQAMATGRAVKA